MNITKGKTPVESGLITDLINAFLDGLGQALKLDFKSIFGDMCDGYSWDDSMKLKSGKTPFKKEKVDGKDLILYPDYKKQEETNGTWGSEGNPDDQGRVDSDKTNQVVISDEAIHMSPDESEAVPNLVVTWAPIMSKGYEGSVIAIANYTDDQGNTYEKQGVFKETDKKAWLEKLKQEWKIPDQVNTREERLDKGDETQASTKMTVTLQKVTGSTSYDITLTKINANYNISQVAQDLDAVLSDDTFVDAVPEVETTYLIVSDEDGALDIEEIAEDTSSVADIYQQLMNQTGDMLDYLKIVRWGAKGAIRNDFMSTTESMRWSFEGILDKLGEWIITETGKVPQIIHTNEVIDIDDLSAIELANAVLEKVNIYLDNLDLIYVDFSSEQQSYLDTFKESIKSLCDYSLGRLILQ